MARFTTAVGDNVVGEWSPVKPWPMIPLHAVILPDGRVLSYGTQGNVIYDVWDPAAGLDGGHLTLPNTTDRNLFCSSQIVLPNGSGVFIAGGGSSDLPRNNSGVFDYNANLLTRDEDLNRPRYYSTVTTLLNGESYVQGGTGGEDHPEIRGLDGAFRLLTGADTSDLMGPYPRNYVAPDGRIFGYDGNGDMYYVNTSGSGSLVRAGKLTGATGRQSSGAMFRPGKIINFGGKSSGAMIIDITGGGTPLVSATQTLSSQRRWVNATILADGRVLATGGSQEANELVGVAYSADIWNPSTGRWTRGANGSLPRLYHSMALLLPDASVLVGGGGNPGPIFNDNVEIYYPPYLFDAGGGWASRPGIQAIPGQLEIGEAFIVELDSASPISRVALVKTGSVTHSNNFDQRFLELSFQQTGDQLSVQAPLRAADAPPGYYLLFALSQAGTPSVGRVVRIGIQGEPGGGNEAPDIINPGAQSGQIGLDVSLQLVATDPEGGDLMFAATGLPPGLTIDTALGIVSGSPTTVGTFSVNVAVSDGTLGDSASFNWTITQGQSSFVLNPLPIHPPVVHGTEVTLEASVTGGTNVLYRWDFDDGTPPTSYADSPTVQHTFPGPGIYYVTVTAIDDGGIEQVSTVVVTIHLPLTPGRPSHSSSIAIEARGNGDERLWVVNPDNDSVSVFDTNSNARIAEIPVGTAPRTLAVTGSGEIWVTNKFSSSISVVDPDSLQVARTITLPFASQPYGIAMTTGDSFAYLLLEGLGRLLKIDTSNDTIVDSMSVGINARHVSVNGDGTTIFVSRFISPPLPGESTAQVQTESGGQAYGGEVLIINAATLTFEDRVTLHHSDKPDFDIQGRGVPNYLGAATISPDGRSAWVPSKQDNVRRGMLRDQQGLNFQNTVRAISSRINLTTRQEDQPRRIDHDNSGVASSIEFDKLGIYMFVALETSREVVVVDAHGGWEVFRINVGRAPHGLAISSDGNTLYVSNFMDRTIGVYDVTRLIVEGIAEAPLVVSRATVGSEKLSAEVLLGKRLFYDAKDPRLARDAYISCASCHNDGGHDGRVWDLTGFGEGLRNTVALRGRGAAHGFLHWSNNFDEVQDFEGQIRGLAGGTGLMTNAQLNSGTRNQPLGDRKSGISADLDALAAYVASLGSFAASPYRAVDGNLTSAAQSGRAVFIAKNCASCHGGSAFTNSASNNPRDIGTITAESGGRLFGTLSGIDIPTLRDAWATAPYLHKGSAATLSDAIRAHSGLTITDEELANLAAYVAQIGNGELEAPGEPPPPPPTNPSTGTGLSGSYFNNTTLAGASVLQRIEAVNFGWAGGSPGPGVNPDRFSVRWTGRVEASSTGNFRFQTNSNDGVRLWINGALIIDNWTDHSTTNNNSGVIALTKNQRYLITMEFYDNTGPAVARLRWQRPSDAKYSAIPANRLYLN